MDAERLARVLARPADDEECGRCLDSLEAYCAAQLAGQPARDLMPAVADHLDSCALCSEAYAALYEAALAPDAIPAPPTPWPDLGFLPGSLRAMLAAAVSRAGDSLRLTLTRALAAALPPPALSLALRSSGGAPLLELEVAQEEGRVERLAVTAVASSQPGRCSVLVRVALRGRAWPDLGGAAVSLEHAGERRSATTDAFGEVLFADLPAAAASDATIEVAPPPAG